MSKNGSGNGINFLREKIDEALDSVKMESWGAWLNVGAKFKVSELENYKISRERDSFIADSNGNTINPVYGDNVYAKIESGIFNPKPGEDEYYISLNFFVNN